MLFGGINSKNEVYVNEYPEFISLSINFKVGDDKLFIWYVALALPTPPGPPTIKLLEGEMFKTAPPFV